MIAMIIRKLREYGIIGSLRLVRDLIFTKYTSLSARIIRYPCYIRGRRYVMIGRRFTTGVGLRIDAFPKFLNANISTVIIIGNDVEVNDYVHIAAVESVVIEDGVLIASKVFISDHNHGGYSGLEHSNPGEPPAERRIISSPVHIGKNVWIGEHVVILPGVSIGVGSIIGAGAVVTRSIPDHSIVGGNPARILKRYNQISQQWEKI